MDLDKLDKFRKKQIEYWQKRQELLFTTGEKNALQVVKELQTLYDKCYKEIEQQILIFYGKYAKQENITLSDAKRILNKRELKSFNEYLSDILKLYKKQNLNKNQIKQLEILQYKKNISRLTELQTHINEQLINLALQNQNEIKDLLSDTYTNTYYNTIYNVDISKQLSTSFTQLNSTAIKQAIATPILTANYSETLWKNKDNLMAILNQELARGLVLGYGPQKLVQQIINKKLATNYNNTVRLVRTEYNNIFNQATAESYTQCKIDKYQILATLDNRTSEICQEMDLKLYNVADIEVGLNYPPFHPNCRTTTIPYFEPDEFDTPEMRIARDESGETYYVPANVNYKQWKANLVKQRNGKLRYENNDN